ncbi:hypothetical protein HDV05_007429 [Chytridiales sp. JEL 0842]|nr:hypothetical protein HDV05_007429 [Chytridiales sp. JEL 0842]
MASTTPPVPTSPALSIIHTPSNASFSYRRSPRNVVKCLLPRTPISTPSNNSKHRKGILSLSSANNTPLNNTSKLPSSPTSSSSKPSIFPKEDFKTINLTVTALFGELENIQPNTKLFHYVHQQKKTMMKTAASEVPFEVMPTLGQSALRMVEGLFEEHGDCIFPDCHLFGNKPSLRQTKGGRITKRTAIKKPTTRI